MKKIIFVTLILVSLIFTVSCGNKQIFDTTYTFDKAMIRFPDGEVISGKIDSWTDYEDGDQIQVKINGITYLVHSSNVVLISK